jgi:hypothetical protein
MFPVQEERFMFVIYPSICLAAASCLAALPVLLCVPLPKKYHRTVRLPVHKP